MDKYIDSFPAQLREALIIGYSIPELSFKNEIRNIVICGMGGSGIGGAFVKELSQKEISIPVILNQSYELPSFVNVNSFVICSSYSGNTEETISNLRQAIERNSEIICVTTGGEIEKIANDNLISVVKIPGGMPPRSCLGYSMIAQLFILMKGKFISENIIHSIEPAITWLESNQLAIKPKAVELSKKLSSQVPLIYSSVENSAIAIRWKQQINENAKMHCFANIFPEMNHNELVAFETTVANLRIVLLRNSHDHPRIAKRFDLLKELIGGKAGSIIELWSEGNTEMEKLFYFIHLGDWVSLYLSGENHCDPMEIKILDALKKRLGSLN